METTTRPTPRAKKASTLLLSLALALLGAAYAQVCNYETEPNDDPATATVLAMTGRQSFDATPICVSGGFSAGEQGGRDFYRWDVTDAEALQRWVIEVENASGQATTLILSRAASEGTAGAELLALDSPDGRPVASQEIQLEPGRYYLRASSGGVGDYVVTLRPVNRVDRSASRMETGRRFGDEINLYGSVSGELAFEWSVDARYAGYLWGIETRSALGAPVAVTISGPSGEIARLNSATSARRDGIVIEPGQHTVRVEGVSGTVWLRLERQGQRSSGAEVEPNDTSDTATALLPDTELRGTFDGNDYYRFDIGSRQGATTWRLVVTTTGAEEFDFYLEDGSRTNLAQHRASEGFERTYTLPPGTYFLRFNGRQGEYLVALNQAAVPGAGTELEPNDVPALATKLNPAELMSATLEGRGRDLFSLDIEGEAQLYRLQVIGAGVNRMRVLTADENVFAEVRGDGRLRIDDLVLLPGVHLIEVLGSTGDYRLLAMPLGPAPTAAQLASHVIGAPAEGDPLAAAVVGPTAPDLDGFDTDPGPPPPPGIREREPNDDDTRAHRLYPGSVHVGRLASGADQDFYRFHLLADQYVRIELVPPLGGVSIHLYLDRLGWIDTPVAEAGSPIVVERWFLAGDHSVMVGMRSGAEAPTGYYQLRITQLNSALTPVDDEPNDERYQAGLLPAELTWTGTVGVNRDEDYYRLPTFQSETQARFVLSTGSGVELGLLSETNTVTSARAGTDLEVALAAGEVHYLRVRGSGNYEISAEFSNAPDASQLLNPRSSGALALSLVPPAAEVAAFWHQGQVLASPVTVENRANVQQSVEFDVVVSDTRAEVSPLPPVTLAPGERRTVDVSVALPPELRDDQGIRVDIAARSSVGHASAVYTAVPLCEAVPVMPFEHHGVRQALAGRLNVLWDGLGARVAGNSNRGQRDAGLINGRISPSYSGTLDSGHSPTFEIAGTEPLTVIGALLNPLGEGRVEERLKGFRIETSLDGATFQLAYQGELASASVEQAFEFPAPVRARYARLVFVSSHDGRDRAYLGTFKLIAEDPAALGPLDLADPLLGGHVAWTSPLLGSYGAQLLSSADDVNGTVDLRDTGSLTFVVGFQDGRAAQIERLTWRDSPRSVGDRSPVATEVMVEVSVAGPAGPWQPLAEWELERDQAGVAELSLSEPVWARFLRFTVPMVDGERNLWPPDEVSVFERRAGTGGYFSALGEWGTASSRGTYEAQLGLANRSAPQHADIDPGETAQTALRLTPGTQFQDSVTIGEDVDWLVFSVPQGQNYFELTLSGDPAIGYSYRVLDRAMNPVAFEVSEEAGGARLFGFAEPGDYYLHLEEPKRTVVFAWDNSGSMGPYLSIVYNSLATFALGVDGDREAVQLLAFNDPQARWLLPIWSSDPQRVQYALATYDRKDSSSNAEAAMLEASRALAQRSGTRAILLITDAESNGYSLTSELWESLHESRPRVFTFEVSSSGNAIPQDLMQDWALVNGGSYLMAASVGDVDAGFTRAACILRRPKGYTALVATRFQQPPGPGTLTVVRTLDDAAGSGGAGGSVGSGVSAGSGGSAGSDGFAPAVEVIFDASGSMGRALPSGEQRIVAAKRAVEQLIGEVLPDGTHFALRAFGHISPSSCESRLDVRLAPLDRAAAVQAVRAIEPKLLSQTPLADALAAVAQDLSGAGASRIVILVTDGVESCGGDPAAAVAALKAAGQIELAIVSLGVEADAQAIFGTLAAGVGASYVDVGSFETLIASLETLISSMQQAHLAEAQERLHPPFEVLDPAGQVVASGRVGDAGISLPMGLYTVRLVGAPPTEFHEVLVPGDGSVTVDLGR
ncbi:MAG: VWA domain-containing protein [Trueperaceae bacterium]|nr:VWA domain-containing protein [Trueperaceae bacterium]